MIDRREAAREAALAFNARTLDAIGRVLESHSTSVVEFAVSMYDRIDAAESFLQRLGKCPCIEAPGSDDVVIRLPKELSDQLVQMLVEIQSRPQ